MKIAISSDSNTLDQVEPRFGRAAYFIIYDLESDTFTSVENRQAIESSGGAGIQAAQNIINAGATALITGHCGPNAFKALQAANIDVYVNVSGSMAQAIEDFKNQKLEKAQQADVSGHWM